MKIYLLPGLGTDDRLFSKIKLEGHEIQCLQWLVPEDNESLEHYALRLAEQIDTSQSFSLIGVSFGGMCAVEIAKVLHPEKVILISSAKTAAEIPFYIRVFKYLPFHKWLSESLLIKGSKMVKRLFSRLDADNTNLLIDMLVSMPPRYLSNSIDCIVKWNNESCPVKVYHIHGTSDRIIRFNKEMNATGIKGGTHFMVLQKSEELMRILNKVLSE